MLLIINYLNIPLISKNLGLFSTKIVEKLVDFYISSCFSISCF